MVKEFYLGLFAAIVCALAALTCAVPIGKSNHQSHQNGSLVNQQPQVVTLSDDGSIRSERSTNLSHITGSARKIRMYVKNRHLQVLPDGTVNGTSDDTSDYTVLQRTTVNIGQLKIQGVATCQYLCMDSCGLLYGSKEFLDECVFNEMIEQHHYNTYSSARYSNAKRTMYLALNRRGQPRKVQIRARQQLGKLSTYTRVLTQPVSPERVEDLVNRLLHGGGDSAIHPLRHHGSHMCSAAVSAVQPQAAQPTAEEQRAVKHSVGTAQLTDSPGVDRLRCRRRKKRKKKRRRCQDGEDDESCQKKPVKKNANNKSNMQKCEHASNKDECQRVAKGELVTIKKKQIKKQKLGDKQLNSLRVVKKNNKKQNTTKISKRLSKKLKVSEEVSVDRLEEVGPESTMESPQVDPDEDYALTSQAQEHSTVPTSSASVEESSTWEDMHMGIGSSTTDVDAYDENPISVSTSQSPQPQPD